MVCRRNQNFYFELISYVTCQNVRKPVLQKQTNKKMLMAPLKLSIHAISHPHTNTVPDIIPIYFFYHKMSDFHSPVPGAKITDKHL